MKIEEKIIKNLVENRKVISSWGSYMYISKKERCITYFIIKTLSDKEMKKNELFPLVMNAVDTYIDGVIDKQKVKSINYCSDLKNDPKLCWLIRRNADGTYHREYLTKRELRTLILCLIPTFLRIRTKPILGGIGLIHRLSLSKYGQGLYNFWFKKEDK